MRGQLLISSVETVASHYISAVTLYRELFGLVGDIMSVSIFGPNTQNTKSVKSIKKYGHKQAHVEN